MNNPARENSLADIAAHLTPKELKRVQAEVLATRLGLDVPARHFYTGEVLGRAGVSLRDIVNMGLPADKQRSFSSSDFTSLLHTANFARVSRNFPAPKHRAFLHLQPVPDFNEFSLAAGADGVDLVEVLGELGEPAQKAPLVDMLMNVGNGKVRSFRRRLAVSRQMSFDTQVSGWLKTVPAAMVAAAYRLEATEVFKTLESNPTLNDGSSLFIEGMNQTTGATAFDLDALMQLFHAQTTSNGDYLRADLGAVIWPTAHATSAETVQQTLAQAGINVPVIPEPTATYGYAIANPRQYPTIALFTLSEDSTPLLEAVDPAHVRDNREVSVIFSVIHDFTVVPVSRSGIVRLN